MTRLATRSDVSATRDERIERIRDAMARHIPLSDLREMNAGLWPPDERGRKRWGRDCRLAGVGAPTEVTPPPPRPKPVADLPSIPCARTMRSALRDPGVPLELPRPLNARLWDGTAGSSPIVPVSEITNVARLEHSGTGGPLAATLRADAMREFQARRAARDGGGR